MLISDFVLLLILYPNVEHPSLFLPVELDISGPKLRLALVIKILTITPAHWSCDSRISVALAYIVLGCFFVTYNNLFTLLQCEFLVSHIVLTGYKFNKSIIFIFNWNKVMNPIFPIKSCFPHYYEALILLIYIFGLLECDSLTCFVLFLILHSSWFAHRMG